MDARHGRHVLGRPDRRSAPPRRPRGARRGGPAHVRAVDWLERPFGEHDVPAGVAATFARGGRNFQRTHGDAVERRTAELWAAARPDHSA